MKFTDENGKQYEADTEWNFGEGFVVRPVQEKQYKKYEYNLIMISSDEEVAAPYALDMYVDCSPEQAESLAKAVEALLEYVQSESGYLQMEGKAMIAMQAARKTFQEKQS